MRAVVSVTVMHVLLFVLHVCMCCESARVTAVLVWGPAEVCCGEWYTWFRCFV